jgi:DNA-binding PucR family transcriptional regulator
MPRRPDPQRARAALAERLAERRAEIERAVITRVHAIADPKGAADSTYAEGLRTAVGAAIDYGLASIEQSQARPPLVPAALLTQARIAARNGITLDTVLRRYFAGYTLFGDFLVGEMQDDDSVSAAELQSLLLTQAASFDRLIAAITEEHARESEARIDSTEQRRVDLVQRLLAGELVEASELAEELRYDFDGHHVGLVVAGLNASQALRELSAKLDCQLLLVHPQRGTAWAWLGGRHRIDPVELMANIELSVSMRATVALSEPGEGLSGWRLSHRQALAALPVAQRGDKRLARYRDVALFAAILHDDLLVTSLRQLYLEPLEQERDGGEAAKETLRRYFSTCRNVSSTAASLGVTRNTVANRLRAVEETIGQPLMSCASALEVALFMNELVPPTHQL